MKKNEKKAGLDLKKEMITITESYKQILEIKKEIITKLNEFLDKESEIKTQIIDPYWTFEKDVNDLIGKIEDEGKNNNLISYFLENLKKGIK